MAAAATMAIPEIPKREGVEAVEWNQGLDALDLHIPHPAISIEITEGGAITLTKADPHELQRKANKFRQGYKNWRQKKPRGARGEARELKDQPGEEEEPSAIPEPGTHPTMQHGRTISLVRGGGEAKKALGSSATISLGSGSRGVSEGKKLLAAASALGAEEGDALPELRTGMRRGKSFSVSVTAQELGIEAEENWLKFYVNPFAGLLDKKVEPRELNMQNLDTILNETFKHVRGRGPRYDRTATDYLRMCHVGVGGFHRSHQAVYTDDLLEVNKDDPAAPRWAICGVGLMPWDKRMYEALRKQDHMYTVLFRSQEGNDARVVGSIFDFVFAPDDYAALFATLFDPATRIVSLTITEKGYCQNVDGDLDTEHPGVKHDVAELSQPRTALGMLVAALDQRRKAGRKPFTVLSCDNQPDNGHQLEKLVKQMAKLCVGPELKAWIDETTTFPNTMVDRITPATEDVHRQVLKQDFGVEDEWPVVAEHFGQWIVEDKFVDGRPAWEDVGVMFVPDVKPYEYMKLRLLNGTHSALSYVAHLSCFQFVDDALNHGPINDFVVCYMDEVCHSVPAVPGMDLEVYKKSLVCRFSNPYVKDKVERLMLDGSKKLLNTMREAIAYLTQHNLPMTYVGLAVAAYIRYVTGISVDGEEIPEVLDPMAEELREPARQACRLRSLPPTPTGSAAPPVLPPNVCGCEGNGDAVMEAAMATSGEDAPLSDKEYDPRDVVRLVFGKETAGNEAFIASVARSLRMICEKGTPYTLIHIN